MKIPFNKPHMTGRELHYISEAHVNGQLAGDGPFTVRCHQWLEHNLSCRKALLTHSCTAALEMSAMLLDIEPGDEVIMPSFTFVSSANAFVKFGGVPVFVDIRPDTLNIDETLIEAAITDRTKAVVPVHYAGMACEMDVIMKTARSRGLAVIEDAAQGILSDYRGQALGTIGDAGTLSFHETKNVISGEGGALLLRDSRLVELAEIIREKGTDRSRFFRNEVDKYTWQSKGSSYLPGEIIAAFLAAQLDSAKEITAKRLQIWGRYHDSFEELETKSLIKRPTIPEDCTYNGHIYYVRLIAGQSRDLVIAKLAELGVNAVFHYVPLHSSPAGRRLGRAYGNLVETERAAEDLIRLPLWVGMTDAEVAHVVAVVEEVLLDG